MLSSVGDGTVREHPLAKVTRSLRIKAITADVTGEPLPVLYGGSVNPKNCCELALKSDIDGLFIGRSAWDPSGFIGILQSVTAALGD